MATYRTSVENGGSTGTSNRTATMVPAVGDLWVVFCAVSNNSNDTPTCSDNNGGTYDLISIGNYQSALPQNYRFSAFIRRQLHVNTTSTVVTVATGANDSGQIVMVAVSGMTRAGSNAVVQVAKQDAIPSDFPTPTFAANALTGNLTLCAVANSSNPPAMTAPTGWTERQDASATVPITGVVVNTRDSGFTGTVPTPWSSSATQFASVFVELDNTPPTPPPSNLAAALGLLLMAWQPMQPAQPVRVDIAPTIATVVTADVPPPPPQDIGRILSSWRPAQPVQSPRVLIAPTIPTLTADAPPPQDGRNLARIIGQWWKPVRHGTSGSVPPAVDEVPPSRPRLEQILAQWTPAAPIQPRPRVFTPGYVPDQPPPATRAALTAITQASWIPPPGLPPRASLLVPITPAAQVDAPPPASRAVVTAITQASWSPTPGLPPRAPLLVQPSVAAPVNDPPFDSRRAALGPIYSAWKWRAVGSGDSGATPQADAVPPVSRHPEILASWTPAPALPQLSVRSVPQAADTFQPAPRQRPEILSNWTPSAAALPQISRTVATLPGASVDLPPPTGTATSLAIVRTSWLSAPGLPPRAPQLVPIAAAAAVNDPPFDSRRAALGPIYSAWKWRPVGSGDSAAVPPVVNDPPFARKPELRPMLSAWQPAPEQVVYVSRLVFEFVPDDPPFGLSRLLTPILSAWLPAPPASQWGRHVPPSVADVPVNDPPFGLRPSAPTILRSWAPPPMPVVAPTRAPIPTVVAQVDSPPPLTRQPLAILSAWQPLPALQPARPDVVQEAAAPSVDNPPPAARPLTAILTAWQPSPQATQRAPQTPQVAAAVADVPPTTRPWLGPILAGWQAPTLLPTPRPWLAAIPGVSVDPPPIQRSPSLTIIRAAWEPPAPLPTLPVHLAQERPPDPPPFGLRSWLPATLRAWQPGPPAPQWGRHVPVSVSAVPVNDPPFGIRPWLPTVRSLWIPGPPHPITRPIVATESGPSTQIPLLVVTAIRIQRAHADGIWVTPAMATAPRIVKAHATGMSVAPARATAPHIQRAHATNVRIILGG